MMTTVTTLRAAPLIATLVGTMGLLITSTPVLGFFHSDPDVTLGEQVYQTRCAACHGAMLEGQPNWQSANDDGTYPAPPHDASGHTWHHGDAMLLDYIRRGGQAVLDDMGVTFTSGMPAFGAQLTGSEIEAVLAYIKSTWPDQIRAAQEDRTRSEAAGQ